MKRLSLLCAPILVGIKLAIASLHLVLAKFANCHHFLIYDFVHLALQPVTKEEKNWPSYSVGGVRSHRMTTPEA
jgi:hypothetical protein